jgi:hypothetical protein
VQLDDLSVEYGIISVYVEEKLRGETLEAAILKISPRRAHAE